MDYVDHCHICSIDHRRFQPRIRIAGFCWSEERALTAGHVAVRTVAHSPEPHSYLETVTLHSAGLVRISGWSLRRPTDLTEVVRLEADGQLLRRRSWFRTFRPDVRAQSGAEHDFHGVIIDYQLPPVLSILTLRTPNRTVHFDIGELGVQLMDVPYSLLFEHDQVLHRDNIYGSGPPLDTTAIDVLSAASRLTGPILDFGCGNGALLRRLRTSGLSVAGIEIDRPEIRNSVADDVRPFITLYDGQLPAPYPTKSFDSVVAVEVIEHVPDLVPLIAELARLARKEVLLTTPDISAIPLLSVENVVPWHLLEATHVNFFTQHSLDQLLRTYFGEVEFGRIGPNTINGTQYWTSFMVWCREPLDPRPSS